MYPNDPVGMQGHMHNQMPGIGYQQAQPNPYASQGLAADGGISDVFTLLHEEYRAFVALEIEKRQAIGQKVAMTLEEAMTKAPFTSFFNFSRRYLAQHRPVQQFVADGNVGVMLSNNKRVLLCPAMQGGFAGHGGSMQHSGDINITPGQRQPGMEGVIPQGDGGIRVI